MNKQTINVGENAKKKICFQNNTADEVYLDGNVVNCTQNKDDSQLDSSFIDDDVIEDARIRFEWLRSNHIPDKQEISDSNTNLSERRLCNSNDNDDTHSDYPKISK